MIKKLWHHYLNWEDFKNGMWSSASGEKRKAFLNEAIEFTGNHEDYGSFMKFVIFLWPVACEQNITDPHINRKAWIGHAACSLAIGCPEDITREAWRYLTQEQQDLANEQAEIAIELWEDTHARKNNIVYKQMAFPGV